MVIDMNNKYGLDSDYFKKKLSQLVRDADNYTPREMSTALSKLKNVSDHAVANGPLVFNPITNKEE